jgi:hypothetical protein
MVFGGACSSYASWMVAALLLWHDKERSKQAALMFPFDVTAMASIKGGV